MFYINTGTIYGIEALPVIVETDISFGMGNFQIVGMPDTTVKEARDRIKTAIKESGFTFPRTRITVNLAPATVKKQGSSFDLPIALSVLGASNVCSQEKSKDLLVIGELSLDGTLRPVRGVLPVALLAKKMGYKGLIVPFENGFEGAYVSGLSVFAAKTLKEVVDFLNDKITITPSKIEKNGRVSEQKQENNYPDFSTIKGQGFAKRGMEIAAAGAHNVLLSGPPGTGKTMLARALPSILPTLTEEEALEATVIASVAGVLSGDIGLIATRPFRSPHHSTSATALIGGGATPRPGEVSLAHRGVLFLDELAEFSKVCLEYLRQPLEDGLVTIARASGSATFPAQFMLVGATNPCPCGFLTDPHRTCTCSTQQLNLYGKRLSGPIKDRFDMMIEVPFLEPTALFNKKSEEKSEDIKKRIQLARNKQEKRFQNTSIHANAHIPAHHLESWCSLSADAEFLLKKALNDLHISARGHARIRKVARTIADLDDANQIEAEHIAEALQFRHANTQF